MKRNSIIFSLSIAALIVVLAACKKDDPINDSPMPNGEFTVERSGTFTAENNQPTAGTVEYGKDEDDVYFVKLGSDFTTDQATGTLGLYFSTSAVFTSDPGNGNPDLMALGTITQNGEQYIKLDEAVASNFTHIILWCNTASVSFGNAQLQ